MMTDNTRTILVAEDNMDLMEELAAMLAEEGYSVGQAGNGKEALSYLDANHVDLLISDIYMPEIDGLELSLYARERFPDIKIFLISGGGRLLQQVDGASYLRWGKLMTKADEIFKKPFLADDLLAEVNRYLMA
jgi:two-component system cell cycle response regulator CpdR